jgi:Na+:H+ antiporter, NhaA family
MTSNPLKFFKWFVKLESSSGIVLLSATVFALLVSNSSFSEVYFETLKTYVEIGLSHFYLKLSVNHWINDGLMAFFFLFLGLEIKRECLEGELSKPSQAILPIVAAIGGAVVPALFYIVFNFNSAEAIKGWAIPSATDIAFSLAVLSLLGSRVPIALKVFLVALAIVDDLAAIIIIALFYTAKINILSLALMLVTFSVLLLINRIGVRKFFPYMLGGLLLWVFTYQSGIHATIAGVLLAVAIPHYPSKHNAKKKNAPSLLKTIEHAISPYVTYFIMPLFAFANAGLDLRHFSLSQLMEPIALGVTVGLFFGKQIGVFLFAYIAIMLGYAQKSSSYSYVHLYGVAVLTGIGFTMSLFVGNLTFPDSELLTNVKIGVLTGSFFSAIFGYWILRLTAK